MSNVAIQTLEKVMKFNQISPHTYMVFHLANDNEFDVLEYRKEKNEIVDYARVEKAYEYVSNRIKDVGEEIEEFECLELEDQFDYLLKTGDEADKAYGNMIEALQDNDHDICPNCGQGLNPEATGYRCRHCGYFEDRY